MKKNVVVRLSLAALLGLGGYWCYRNIMPKVIASAVISDDSLPAYVPGRLRSSVDAIRKPINKGTGAIIAKMHETRMPLDEVLSVIDNTTDEQVNAFLDDIEAAPPADLNHVFDVVKKHFGNEVDIEPFREPFVKNFKMEDVRNALNQAILNRKRNDIETSTARAIVKMILIEKDKEMRSRPKPEQ